MNYLFPAQQHIQLLSQRLGQKLLARHWHVATAESCTGGAVAAAITQIAGSSQWFEYGIVCYANRAKQHLLGVQDEILTREGAVSEAVVTQMAKGVLELSQADVAIAVSGIAGPDGGSLEKPVGTVWFAWVLASGEVHTQKLHFTGDRGQVQLQAVEQALQGLLALIDENLK